MAWRESRRRRLCDNVASARGGQEAWVVKSRRRGAHRKGFLLVLSRFTMLLAIDACPPPLRPSFPPRRRVLQGSPSSVLCDWPCRDCASSPRHVSFGFPRRVPIRYRRVRRHVTTKRRGRSVSGRGWRNIGASAAKVVGAAGGGRCRRARIPSANRVKCQRCGALARYQLSGPRKWRRLATGTSFEEKGVSKGKHRFLNSEATTGDDGAWR